VPEGLQPGKDEARYARACEAWMSQIRAVAGQSPTGADFKARVDIGLGTLARDAENQIVVVSSTPDLFDRRRPVCSGNDRRHGIPAMGFFDRPQTIADEV
jgi:hypothetical protein